MNTTSLPMLWANSVELLKDRINNRSFWEALEATHPITIENDTLIIGLDSANFNRASHIQQSAHFNAIVRAVEERFNQPLKVRLIEGSSVADWEATKEREARLAALKQSPSVTNVPIPSALSDSWETLSERIARIYSGMPNRSLPQGKARYANEALYTLVEAMDTLYEEEGDETTERSLARILERIATASEIPAPVLAFELERLRAWRKSEAG